MPLSVDFPQSRKPDLREVGRETYEVVTNTGRRGYKQRMRKRTFKTEREQNYAPSEVAAILIVSYDAALRLTQKMKGMVDLGTPTLRISSKLNQSKSADALAFHPTR